MRPVIIIAVWVSILVLIPPCCGLRSRRSPDATIATTTLETTLFTDHQTSPSSALITDTSRVPTVSTDISRVSTTIITHFTTTKDYFPENSQIAIAINQQFGEVFLTQFTSPSVRCAMDHVFKEYRTVFENDCNTENLQKISEEIKELCYDELWFYWLTLERAKKNGIRVCIDSTVKIDRCPETGISDQQFCDDFYVLTLNCSLTPNNTEANSSTSTSNNKGTIEHSDGVSVALLTGVALSCFIFGILITLLVVLILYKCRHQIRKQDEASSISSRNFPNLRRQQPMPRNISEIYEQIEVANEIHQEKLTSVSNVSENNYDQLNARKLTKQKVPVRYISPLKRDYSSNDFYTFDPRKSVDDSATQEITKYGKISHRDRTDSKSTDSKGNLSSSKLSQTQAREDTTTTDSNENITGIAKIEKEKRPLCIEEEEVEANMDLRDGMDGTDCRDSVEWFTGEEGNKEKQNVDEKQKDTNTKGKETGDILEETS
ncbi:uncharacterized protein LOC134236813 [Saccostrea cucullata]|uniref:uncharacterized protein LOC134236813 n=1 Tax=Saccostrea cuccullata TaxID=36930 RepID=UPI002ED37ECC